MSSVKTIAQYSKWSEQFYPHQIQVSSEQTEEDLKVARMLNVLTKARPSQNIRDLYRYKCGYGPCVIIQKDMLLQSNTLRRNLKRLNKKVGSDLQPVFTSRKIMDEIKVVEAKPPLINQHCIVYKFSCNLCDSEYVGFTSRHLFQRIAEHKYSAIGQHLKEDHKLQGYNVQDQFTVLKKCRMKLVVYFTKCSSSGT